MALFVESADMASLLRRFKRKGQSGANIYSLEDYDKTFAVTKSIMKMGGLRLLRSDSNSRRFLWDMFYWFSFGNLFIVTWLEFISMVQTAQGGSFQDAVAIFRMMPCIGYLILGIAKSYKIVYHRPVYENLYSELRAMWPRGPVSDEEHRIISTALTALNVVIKGYYWCNNTLLVIFLSPPFLELLKRTLGHDASLTLPFLYWLPFDPFQSIYYEIILVLQTWHGTVTIWFMLCGDLLFCIYLSHITTQFDLLSARIRRLVHVPVDGQLIEEFPLAACKAYDQNQKHVVEGFGDKEWEKVHLKNLSEIIDRHRALIRLSGDVENMFSFALLVNFINSSVIICFCGFCCVIVEKWNEIVYKLFLTSALSQTWLMCWYGQRLLESSEGVSRALYNSGWYKSSQRVKSSILFMIQRSQKEVSVTTYGFSVISLASYTMIIKTAWSYFTLLLNIYSRVETVPT